MTSTKQIVMNIKSVGDTDNDNGLKEGEFIAYASVFGNKDSYGDIVVKGAFANTIAVDKEFPIYWNHQVNDPELNLGITKTAAEDDYGLRVHCALDLSMPKARTVHKLIQEGRVKQLSFMYDVIKYATVDGGPWDGGHYELQELKVHEISIVPVGANQETHFLAVKDGEGREIPVRENRAVVAAVKTLVDALGLNHEPDSEVSAQEQPEAKAEEPETVNAEEQKDVTARKDPDAALAHINALTL